MFKVWDYEKNRKWVWREGSVLPPEKFVSDTLSEMDEVQKGIRSLQGVTQNILHRDKQQLWKQLDEELEKYRSQL